MVNKRAVEYARELANRGFTVDAAREIMLSRGFNVAEADEAITVAAKPQKHISTTTLLGIALIFIIILIPIIFMLSGDDSTIDTTNQDELYAPPTQDNLETNQQEITGYGCSTNEECLFNEDCLNNECSPLYCTLCEEITNHQCVQINCDDNITSTLDYCSEGVCVNNEITTCTNEDNFCPEGCNETTDTDCLMQPACTSDLECADDDPETIDTCISPYEGAPKECVHTYPLCIDLDGYCPANCTTITDSDCDPVCGNNVKEDPEECDGDCPTTVLDCNDNNTCTTNTLLGSASLCTAECVYNEITMCIPNDGCCPFNCVYSTDNDCPPSSTLLATGSFTSVQRITSGDIELYSYESGTHKIIFDQLFSMANTNLDPSLNVYLATKQIVTTKEDLDAGNLLLEPLQQVSGEQEYETLSYISNIQTYNSVVIFNSNLNAVYAYSTLNYI